MKESRAVTLRLGLWHLYQRHLTIDIFDHIQRRRYVKRRMLPIPILLCYTRTLCVPIVGGLIILIVILILVGTYPERHSGTSV